MTASPGQPSPDQARHCPIENTVNGGLTPKRGRPVTENSEYAAFARRILRAYSRRVATGDVESLAHMISLVRDIDNAIQDAVRGLRASGYSWAEIQCPARHHRQAAQQRWAARADAITGQGRSWTASRAAWPIVRRCGSKSISKVLASATTSASIHRLACRACTLSLRSCIKAAAPAIPPPKMPLTKAERSVL